MKSLVGYGICCLVYSIKLDDDYIMMRDQSQPTV